MNIFNYFDYRDLVSDLLAQNIGRGARVQLAQELNCQPGYISQVLSKSKIHFTSENILKISKFLKLGPREEEFLIELLLKEKAGSHELRMFYEQKLEFARKENLSFEKQLQKRNTDLDDVSKGIYYGHWSYIAIHMLISLPGFDTKAVIAKRLQINDVLVDKVLKFLLEKNLITLENGKYAMGETRIHLKKNSPFINSHHQNFRHKAILSLENDNDFDLHYSSVMTLSIKDAVKIRNLLLEFMVKKDEILIPSPNEEMICMNVDLIKL